MTRAGPGRTHPRPAAAARRAERSPLARPAAPDGARTAVRGTEAAW